MWGVQQSQPQTYACLHAFMLNLITAAVTWCHEANSKKFIDLTGRLATLDDLEPLQQLARLTQLGTEGNPCCNLHPVSRFRIEVLARHSTSVQQIDSHKVSQAHDTLMHTSTCMLHAANLSVSFGTASLPLGTARLPP